MNLMRNSAIFTSSVLTGIAFSLLATTAAAQPAPAASAPPATPPAVAPAPAPVAAPAAPAPVAAPAAPAPVAPAAPAVAPATPAPAVAPATPAPVAPPAAVEPAPVEPAPVVEAQPIPLPPVVDPGEEAAADEEAVAKESPLSLFMFADSNYGISSSNRESKAPFHRAYATNGADGTTANGFAMEWLGLDASYSAGAVGATASLRFGDAVPTFFGDKSAAGISNLTQGYLTWTPSDMITLDLGQFGTIYGAEVGESWNNLNYTRGGLYYAMQPFWHTGLRAGIQLDPKFGLTAMVVNGVNSSFDEDDAPSIGLQASLTPNDEFSLYIGGLQTLDTEHDSSGFDTFLDVVATLNIDDFSAVFNADFNQTAGDDSDDLDDSANFYGVSLAVGYALTSHFGIAARYEFLSDKDGLLYNDIAADDTVTWSGANVNTGTLTFDVKPLDTDNLIIRWDNRFEKANEDLFSDVENLATDKWFASVLGVVVKMDE